MARHGKPKSPDRMLLDSGTTSHMTARSDRVQNQVRYETPISLADDSKVNSRSKGVRTVHWKTENGNVKVSLSNTIVAPDIATSLLSVPALAKKNIAELFLPGRAILFDLEKNFKFLGQAAQNRDGLYYIDDQQESLMEPLTYIERSGVSAMRAYVERKPSSSQAVSKNSNTEVGSSKTNAKSSDNRNGLRQIKEEVY